MNAPTAPSDASGLEPLSRFELRCLCQRTRECAELLQLAVLGVEEAQERHGTTESLSEIAELLRDAEQAVAQAHAVASAIRR